MVCLHKKKAGLGHCFSKHLVLVFANFKPNHLQKMAEIILFFVEGTHIIYTILFHVVSKIHVFFFFI